MKNILTRSFATRYSITFHDLRACWSTCIFYWTMIYDDPSIKQRRPLLSRIAWTASSYRWGYCYRCGQCEQSAEHATGNRFKKAEPTEMLFEEADSCGPKGSFIRLGPWSPGEYDGIRYLRPRWWELSLPLLLQYVVNSVRYWTQFLCVFFGITKCFIIAVSSKLWTKAYFSSESVNRLTICQNTSLNWNEISRVNFSCCYQHMLRHLRKSILILSQVSPALSLNKEN